MILELFCELSVQGASLILLPVFGCHALVLDDHEETTRIDMYDSKDAENLMTLLTYTESIGCK